MMFIVENYEHCVNLYIRKKEYKKIFLNGIKESFKIIELNGMFVSRNVVGDKLLENSFGYEFG